MKARTQFPTARFSRDSDGVTMVEFALVVMFLVMVLFGTFDLGWAVYTNNTLSLAAREGARKGIISSASNSAIIQQVKSTAAGLNLQDSNITISRTSDSDGNNFVTVTVTYKYTPLTPFISQLLPSGYLTLTGKATMYVEG